MTSIQSSRKLKKEFSDAKIINISNYYTAKLREVGKITSAEKYFL